MTFHRNLGQVDPNVRFFAHGGAYGVFLTADEGALVLTTSGAADRKKAQQNAVEENKAVQAVRWRFLNANKQTKFSGLDELPFKTNYLRGNDRKQWQTNVAGYARVRVADLYKGIDLFVLKVDRTGEPIYFTLVGQGDGRSIKVSAAGKAFITGFTWGGIPVTGFAFITGQTGGTTSGGASLARSKWMWARALPCLIEVFQVDQST